MAYPAGIQTVTLRLGSSFDSAGTLAKIAGNVVPVFGVGADHLVWEATGQTYAKVSTALTWDDTERVAYATVPHPTQAGWRDQTQAAFSGWSYRITAVATYANGQPQRFERTYTPQAGDTVVDIDLMPNGVAATPTVTAEWEQARSDALAALAATAVDQITLTAPLALTVPAGFPAGQVYRVTLTQDGTGGHLVTYGGQPVTVDPTAGAVTTVELHPAGAGYVVRYPAQAAAETQTATYGSRWVFDGDSITIGSIGNIAGVGQNRGRSWTVVLAGLSMGRIDYLANAAVSGQKSAAALARFDSYVSPNRPEVVQLNIGANDLNDGEAAIDGLLANLDGYLAKCRSIGARLILGAIWPTDNPSPDGRAAVTRKANDRLRAWAASNKIDFIPWDLLADPATGGWPTGWAPDGVHPVGDSAAPAIAAFGWDFLQHRAGPSTVRRARYDADGLLTNGMLTQLSASVAGVITAATAAATTGTLPAGQYTYRVAARSTAGDKDTGFYDVTHTLAAPGGITVARTGTSGSFSATSIYRKGPGDADFKFMVALTGGVASWTDTGDTVPDYLWPGVDNSAFPVGFGDVYGQMSQASGGRRVTTAAGVRGNVLRVEFDDVGGSVPSAVGMMVTGLTAGRQVLFSCLARSRGRAQVTLQWRSTSATVANTVVLSDALGPEWGLYAVRATVPAGADRVNIILGAYGSSGVWVDVAEMLLIEESPAYGSSGVWVDVAEMLLVEESPA